MMKVSVPLLLMSVLLAVLPGACQSYDLVDATTGKVLGDSAAIESMGNKLSNVSAFERLVLEGLGCGRQDTPNVEDPASQRTGSRAQAPCKLEKLYIAPEGDGSPPGKSLAQEIAKAVARDGRVALVQSPKDAQAFFADFYQYTQILVELRREKEEAQRDEALARQAQADAREAADLAVASKVGKPRVYVAYVVETDCEDSEADLTYSAGSGQIEQRTVDAPWAELITYSAGSFYNVSAQKHDGSHCSISASIFSVTLTRKQVDIWSDSTASPVSYIKRHGRRLRGADSDSAYGIADVSW